MKLEFQVAEFNPPLDNFAGYKHIAIFSESDTSILGKVAINYFKDNLSDAFVVFNYSKGE